MSGNLFQKKKDLHWVDYLEIFWRLKWYLIVPVLLSAAAAVVLVIRMPQIYRSSATVLVEPQQVSEDYVKSSIDGIMEDRLAAIRQQILSRSLLQQIIDQFGLYHKESKYLSNEEILDLMRKKIDIKNEMSRKTFTISFENENPKIAMDVTNQLASLFVEENLKVQELVEGTTEFLRKQLDSLKDSLNKQEQVIAEFKQKYRESLPPQLDVNIRALDRYQTELQNLSASISSTEEKKRTLEERARMARVPASVAPDEGADSKAAPDEKSSDDYASLLQMKRSLEDLRLEYTDAYPDIVLLKRKIKDLEDSIYKKQLAAAELDK